MHHFGKYLKKIAENQNLVNSVTTARLLRSIVYATEVEYHVDYVLVPAEAYRIAGTVRHVNGSLRFP